MSSSVLQRAGAIVELLVGRPDGLPLGQIAATLGLPKSATHRMLTSLVELRYVNQDGELGHYRLGLHLVSLGLRHLAGYPLVDLARPMLQQLAEVSGELARLSIADSDGLVWVAKAQGARTGLRYDPDSGAQAPLAHSSSGRAWLSALPEDRAQALVAAEDFSSADQFGPRAARTMDDVLAALQKTRRNGYSYTDSTYELGTASIAVPVRAITGGAVGALSITGPGVRLTEERCLALVPHLLEAAEQLGVLGQGAQT